MNITAILIDQREPEWVKSLKFGGVPTSCAILEIGDLHAVTDDDQFLLIERKTPDDFLNSLKDERLMPQMTNLANTRLSQQLQGEQSMIWPYLIITGAFIPEGKKLGTTSRGMTNWSWAAIQGTLLSIQEMGIFIVFAASEMDYEDCILRLGRRQRDMVQNILPARPAQLLGPKAAFLASLPGIGVERVMEILRWSDDKPGWALCGLTDLEIEGPVGKNIRKNIRQILGLEEEEQIFIAPK